MGETVFPFLEEISQLGGIQRLNEIHPNEYQPINSDAMYSHPVIIGDSDNRSDITSCSFLPSVPDGFMKNDEVILYNADCDEKENEDEEELMQTRASFTGFFKTSPVSKQLEFKRDDITKPKMPNWKDRTEQYIKLMEEVPDLCPNPNDNRVPV